MNNMLELVTTNQFKSDLKRIQKRGYNLQKLHNILNTLRSNQTLSPKYRDHALTGNYIGFRECHIEPDWLLVYAIDNWKPYFSGFPYRNPFRYFLSP